MAKKSFIFLLFSITVFTSTILAKDAKNDYTFRTLSPIGGLGYNGIKQIQQDKQGFIWILMDNDLYRFDGYKYKRYNKYFIHLDKSVEWIFNNMAASLSGYFLVNTNNGLFSYQADTDTFYKVSEKKFSSIKIDNKNIIWGNINNNWNILDIKNEKLYKPLFNGDTINQNQSIYCLDNDNLYIIVSKSVYN